MAAWRGVAGMENYVRTSTRAKFFGITDINGIGVGNQPKWNRLCAQPIGTRGLLMCLFGFGLASAIAIPFALHHFTDSQNTLTGTLLGRISQSQNSDVWVYTSSSIWGFATQRQMDTVGTVWLYGSMVMLWLCYAMLWSDIADCVYYSMVLLVEWIPMYVAYNRVG